MSRQTLSAVLEDLIVTETLRSGTPASPGRVRLYRIRFLFLDPARYQKEYGLSVDQMRTYSRRQLVPQLLALIAKEMKASSREVNQLKEQVGRGSEESFGEASNQISAALAENADESAAGERDEAPAAARGGDDSDGDDEDASSAQRQAKRKEQATYEEEQDGDEEETSAADTAAADEEIVEEAAEVRPARRAADDSADREEVMALSGHVADYKFDSKGFYCEVLLQYSLDDPKVLMVSLVERLAARSVIREVHKVGKCFVEEGDVKDKTIHIATEGVNLRGIWQHDDVIDINRVSSNDIGAILATYGVEAARMTIMGEIGKVFAVYGISVDPRHLALIADYMVRFFE